MFRDLTPEQTNTRTKVYSINNWHSVSNYLFTFAIVIYLKHNPSKVKVSSKLFKHYKQHT